MLVCAAVVMAPGFFCVYFLIREEPLRWIGAFFTQLPKPSGELGGGMATRSGTFVLPHDGGVIGVRWFMGGIYLADTGRKGQPPGSGFHGGRAERACRRLLGHGGLGSAGGAVQDLLGYAGGVALGS